ncbi:MAG: nucleotidyltransferase domain-containing protein [Tepidisphaeraceae bacterium]
MVEERHATPVEPDARTRDFYVDCLRILDRAKIPYVVGGGYAMAYYTGIARNTKDLDIFIKPQDRDRALQTLADAGYRTEFFYPFWIAKALDTQSDAFMDILYNSGNGLCPVDKDWFTHAIDSEVLGYPTRLVPAEEQLWSKAFVQDRDRYDGADVAHLILGLGHKMDWERLLWRFTSHERVLLAHLILFGYAYPSERDKVPAWVIERLEQAVRNEPAHPQRVCQGTFISQKSYLWPVQDWGYADGRLQPHGPLTERELEQLPKE